ncbi:9682_t:CDS:10 [Diversispora eburnea]|uniref:Acyl-coenzyme A oxidase n=1 Tax=Diversispora eburnea TaxID=1213867 RepID=A0A9N8Z6N6_9GLOM|nr:9682_t:CDS:10 [Diversispora eburnea]
MKNNNKINKINKINNDSNDNKDNAINRLIVIQNHLSPGSIDLARERENPGFDAYKIIQRDPELYIPGGHPFDMTLKEQRELVMKQILRYQKTRQALKNDPLLCRALELTMGTYSEAFWMRIYVHDTLFRQAFEMFGTKEQYGLETTATYDKTTKEFIINSPTLGSTKIWIGMAGQTATHTVALCQTIIDNINYGINWFIVPLRDIPTGKPLPGIIVGDLGAKYGRHGLDNGWIQFCHKRVPREYMLMKWSKVTIEGIFIPSPNPALSYITLIGERFSVLYGAQNALGQALTIACRYGCIRRQGTNNEQIMDYQSHYVNLMPGVAIILNRWSQATKLAQTNQSEFLEKINDFHAISSGLKATLTWWGSEVLERVRRSMGGHAYSAYNTIGPAIADWGVTTTGGGDNFVLLQQTAKYLLDIFKNIIVIQGEEGKRKKIGSSVIYLNGFQKYMKITQCNLSNENQLYDLDFTLDIFTWLLNGAQATSSLWNDNQIGNSDSNSYYFNKNQIKMIKNVYLEICKETRKIVIPLVDAWGFPDFILKAPFGRKSQGIIKSLLEKIIEFK